MSRRAQPRPPLTPSQQQLVCEHLDIAEKAAHCYHRRAPSADFDDLMQAALIGLMQAAQSFDPSRGASFATHANNRVKGAILDYVRDFDFVSRRMRKAGKVPVVHPLPRIGREGALDIEDEFAANPSSRLETAEAEGRLVRGLSRLSQTIVTLYAFRGMTMKETARAAGLSESRVSQILGHLQPFLAAKLSEAAMLAVATP